MSEKPIIYYTNILPEVNVQSSIENEINLKLVLHVSILEFFPTSSIEVSDE